MLVYCKVTLSVLIYQYPDRVSVLPKNIKYLSKGSNPREEAGGDSHIERKGLLVRNFEKNP